MKVAAILLLGLISLIATSLTMSRAQVSSLNSVNPGITALERGTTAAAIPPTLSQDLDEILRLIPTKMILRLITRYLLNDAEFQTFVRIVNSYDAFIVRMRFRSQPEVLNFHSWVRSQLLLSHTKFEFDESLELKFSKTTPYWANSVYGWQGFLNEFLSYLQPELLRAHIDMKIAQNGSFAQFWARLKALKPVYERVLAFPETRRLIAQLQAAGINTNQLDQIIRTQFDWINVPVVPGVSTIDAVGDPVPVARQYATQNLPVRG